MIFTISLIIFSLIFCFTSLNIIKIRRQEKIAVGFGNSDILSRHIAAQKNLFDYSTIFILQIFALENFAANPFILSILLIFFIFARLIHFLSLTKIEPNSIKKGNPNFKFRILGMKITFFSIISCAFYLIFLII